MKELEKENVWPMRLQPLRVSSEGVSPRSDESRRLKRPSRTKPGSKCLQNSLIGCKSANNTFNSVRRVTDALKHRWNIAARD